MLYPTLNSLTKKVGNRYLLVNIVAKRAREIAEKAAEEGVKLPDKPVKLAVMEIYKSPDLPKTDKDAKNAGTEEKQG
jgi:DNA-directed RNA polymerase subunit omega